MGTFKSLRPYIIESTRVSFIMGAGDVLAQTFVEKAPVMEVDVVRTAKYTSLGFLFVGPTLRIWYGYLNKVVSSNQSPFKRAFKKMALDQLLFAPVFTVALTGLVGTMNGDTPQKVKRRLETDYIKIMAGNYMLWPAAQMINFSIVPMQYQVTFAQLVAVIWNCYFSMMLNKDA